MSQGLVESGYKVRQRSKACWGETGLTLFRRNLR